MRLTIVLGGAIALLANAALAASPSPYAGQEAREIKALSPQEIADYLAGRGMGLAKAAELNGYPGPAHVLELAAELQLTAEQRLRTEALFQKMQTRAMALGKALVEEETALDRLFASRAASSEGVTQVLARIGALQGQIRTVHLDAHIEQTALLTPAQIEMYERLRGYGGDAAHQGHGRRH